jgi:radical SAM superfamily enzyme YgiQ (UPF0313 family)
VSGISPVAGLGCSWRLHPPRPAGRLIETSRGCTFDCSFCSIIEMRGRNFHTYSFERVLADIRDARDRGARSQIALPYSHPIRRPSPVPHPGKKRRQITTS